METHIFVIAIAATSAFACLYAGFWAGSASLVRLRAALAAQGESVSLTGIVRHRLRSGVVLLLPTACWLLRFGAVQTCAQEAVCACQVRGIRTVPQAVLSVGLAAVCVVAVLVLVITRSVVGALAVATCLAVIAYVVAGSARDKRYDAVREAVPGALESMAACFGVGFTLLQTFKQVAQETPGHLGVVFAHSAHVLETGGTTHQALDYLRTGAHAPDLAFVAVALEVQHQAGGSMRQVLQAAGESVKSELALRRSLRVQTAQARLSARIVVVMPFILVAVFSLVSPDFLTPFFTSALGYVLLGLALAMQVAGVVLVHRALSVDGVS